jgi:hypothetical protein
MKKNSISLDEIKTAWRYGSNAIAIKNVIGRPTMKNRFLFETL